MQYSLQHIAVYNFESTALTALHLDLHLLLGCLLSEFLEQSSGQVSLSKVRNDHDDILARVFRSAAHLQRCMDSSTRRDATQHTLLRGKVTGHLDSIGSGDLQDLIQQSCEIDLRISGEYINDLILSVSLTFVTVTGDEASSDALNLVRASLATRQDG